MKKKKIYILSIIIIICLLLIININKTNGLPENLKEYSKITLKNGLNIIAIDLGGPVNVDRSNSAYGDAAIIEQNGNYLLMDTGTDDNNNILINYLKTQGINRFSIYLSHYHNDHYGKIKDILKDNYFSVDKVYIPNPDIIASKLDASKEWNDTISAYVTWGNKYINDLTNLGANVVIIEKGSSIKIGDASLRVIWDMKNSSLDADSMYNADPKLFKNRFINDTSVVSIITYKGIKYLNAGDIEEEAEKDIIRQNIDVKADIFKFSHHGAVGSNSIQFVDKVSPIYAYFPNNYTAGNNVILWYGDRENGKYRGLVDSLTSRTNVLSTLYNGNILYNISPNGIISTDITRNYNTLTIKNIDRENDRVLTDSAEYLFNDRSPYHLNKINYIKNIENYKFISSTYSDNDILTINKTITNTYQIDDITINYNTKELTNGAVLVTAHSPIQLKEQSGWNLSEDKKSLSKVYNTNIIENVTFYSIYNNKFMKNIEINNIDKDGPKYEIFYSKIDDKILVTIKSDEELQIVEGWNSSEDRKSIYKYYNNNDKKVVIKDMAGNTTNVSIKVPVNKKDEKQFSPIDNNTKIEKENEEETSEEKEEEQEKAEEEKTEEENDTEEETDIEDKSEVVYEEVNTIDSQPEPLEVEETKPNKRKKIIIIISIILLALLLIASITINNKRKKKTI